MDLLTDILIMYLVQWWAHTDFGQSCCLLSWNGPLMDYFCGQSHQAWPQIPNTQGVSCGTIGVGAQSARGQKAGLKTRFGWMETQKRAWPQDNDHCPSFLHTLVLQWEVQAIGLYRSHLNGETEHEDTLQIITGDLESRCGHLQTFKFT